MTYRRCVLIGRSEKRGRIARSPVCPETAPERRSPTQAALSRAPSHRRAQRTGLRSGLPGRDAHRATRGLRGARAGFPVAGFPAQMTLRPWLRSAGRLDAPPPERSGRHRAPMDREQAWPAILTRLQQGWRAGRPSYDPSRRLWEVSAVGPKRGAGHGPAPEIIVGERLDELA